MNAASKHASKLKPAISHDHSHPAAHRDHPHGVAVSKQEDPVPPRVRPRHRLRPRRRARHRPRLGVGARLQAGRGPAGRGIEVDGGGGDAAAARRTHLQSGPTRIPVGGIGPGPRRDARVSDEGLHVRIYRREGGAERGGGRAGEGDVQPGDFLLRPPASDHIPRWLQHETEAGEFVLWAQFPKLHEPA